MKKEKKEKQKNEKNFLIVLFILVQGLIFAAGKNLVDIKTLKFDVVEKTIIKSKKRELTYKIDFILPNKIKKEVIAPKLNKGEIYMYDYSANKKSVYLPMFNETKESEIVDDENRENEGDLFVAAEKATYESINLMATYARGLTCTPMQVNMQLD